MLVSSERPSLWKKEGISEGGGDCCVMAWQPLKVTRVVITGYPLLCLVLLSRVWVCIPETDIG